MQTMKNPVTNLRNIHIESRQDINIVLAAFKGCAIPYKAAYYLDCDVLRRQCAATNNPVEPISIGAIEQSFESIELATVVLEGDLGDRANASAWTRRPRTPHRGGTCSLAPHYFPGAWG